MCKLINKRILKVSSRSDTIYGSNSRKSMRGPSDPPPAQVWGLNWSVWEDHCFTRQTNYCYTHPRLHVGVCWRQFRHCFLGRWSLGNIVSGARTGKTRDLFNKKKLKAPRKTLGLRCALLGLQRWKSSVIKHGKMILLRTQTLTHSFETYSD